MYFQGIMGPSWYNDIDLWFRKYMENVFNIKYNARLDRLELPKEKKTKLIYLLENG